MQGQNSKGKGPAPEFRCDLCAKFFISEQNFRAHLHFHRMKEASRKSYLLAPVMSNPIPAYSENGSASGSCESNETPPAAPLELEKQKPLSQLEVDPTDKNHQTDDEPPQGELSSFLNILKDPLNLHNNASSQDLYSGIPLLGQLEKKTFSYDASGHGDTPNAEEAPHREALTQDLLKEWNPIYGFGDPVEPKKGGGGGGGGGGGSFDEESVLGPFFNTPLVEDAGREIEPKARNDKPLSLELKLGFDFF